VLKNIYWIESKESNVMPALSKFLVLLGLFLLASHANAFTSLSLVAGNQVRVNHLIRSQEPMSNPTNEPSANRFANQPNKWIQMQSFQTTFHQRNLE
jgi:hypothetical protein